MNIRAIRTSGVWAVAVELDGTVVLATGATYQEAANRAFRRLHEAGVGQ